MTDNPRITAPALKVLKFFLTSADNHSGASISKKTSVGAGTLYPMLARFEAAGWLQSQWEEISPKEAGRPRRRFYRLTGLGATRARAALAEVQIDKVAIGRPVWAS